MIIKWEHATKNMEIYADGKKVGNRAYSLGESFYGPTGMPYKIGNDDHWENHQFHGSVTDIYIFGTALSLDEINKLRGLRILIALANKCVQEPKSGTETVSAGYTRPHRKRQMCYF